MTDILILINLKSGISTTDDEQSRVWVLDPEEFILSQVEDQMYSDQVNLSPKNDFMKDNDLKSFIKGIIAQKRMEAMRIGQDEYEESTKRP